MRIILPHHVTNLTQISNTREEMREKCKDILQEICGKMEGIGKIVNQLLYCCQRAEIKIARRKQAGATELGGPDENIGEHHYGERKTARTSMSNLLVVAVYFVFTGQVQL